MNIIISEDDGWKNLQPLTLTRPLWELRCGITTLGEKIQALFPGKDIGYACRTSLAPLIQERHPKSTVNKTLTSETLFLSGRVIFLDSEELAGFQEDTALSASEHLVGFYFQNPAEYAELQSVDKVELAFKELPRREVKAEIIQYPWDLLERTYQQIALDIRSIKGLTQANPGELSKTGVHIISAEGVFLGEDVSLAPGVVLDASQGPIYLGVGVKVMPNAVIIGPSVVGTNSLIKIGAKIYPGTSIGPVCKVGGEVESSIFHAYSNKQHEGFLGHAYIGEWCNIGAGTENSDLKNNYTPVKVRIGDNVIDSGKLFVGLFMGDHSKTGINTTFNTGTTIGVASMAFGSGFQPKYIPSFHWSDGGKLLPASFQKSMETARTVMARRNRELSEEEINLLYMIHQESQPKRANSK